MYLIIIEALESSLEGLYEEFCFLLTLLYRDQEDSSLGNYFCGAGILPPPNISFSMFLFVSSG